MLPLEGLRALDLGIMYAGPGTSMYLADMGAEVIKVEQHIGDDARRNLSTPYLGMESRAFMVINRGKRDIVLDLQQPEGKEIIHRLIPTCDILQHNFRPGVAERLQVDYPTLSKINPRLIYAWLTAFGSQGPYADKPAYDNVIQGYSGVYNARARKDGDVTGTGTFVADTSAPMLLGMAIGSALWALKRTGHGQLLEVSLLGMAIASQSPQWIRVESEDAETAANTEDPLERACPILECSDGEFITVAVVADQEWQSLCNALGRSDLGKDARFVSMNGRVRHRPELDEILGRKFKERSSGEWAELLKSAGVPAVPIVRRNDLPQQPAIVENGIIATAQHPTKGPIRMFDVPVRLSETPGSIRKTAPTMGEDTDALLAEIGYSPQQIQALREKKVVA